MLAAVSPPPSGPTWPRQSAMGTLILLATEVVTETCGTTERRLETAKVSASQGMVEVSKGPCKKGPKSGSSARTEGAFPAARACGPGLGGSTADLMLMDAVFC